MSKPGLFFRPDEVVIEGERAFIRLAPGANGSVEFFAGTLTKVMDQADQSLRGYRVRCKAVLGKVRAKKAELRLS